MFKIFTSMASAIRDHLCKAYICISEFPRGQTFAEYAIIFAALRIAVFAAYESIGNSIIILGNGLNSDLTSA